jgi:ankyrin repeat protein
MAMPYKPQHGEENWESCRFFLEKGANVDAAGGYYGSALQAAAANGNLRVVSLFLEKGANVNAAGGYYGSALQAAAANGYLEVVSLLLENEANINAKGGRYGSALGAATEDFCAACPVDTPRCVPLQIFV